MLRPATSDGREPQRIEKREGKTDLSNKGDGWLIEALLLRVPDVGRHDLGER